MRALERRGLPAASGKRIPSFLIAAYINGGIRECALSAGGIGISPQVDAARLR
jgi:hypothetical protein